ncbi:GAF domain-containing sensor histidine kinase [Pseudobacteriovorax antillogorgiicola]|uniref:histidine kinase n=1 Tax=Pseudobacteriovorax antillogorgiicola TaxID=1513793 RepID=A0A1Y6CK67_9BACT|nr:GAF domain-containing sensor histidine kinase [Pseudobacteriovorax antillogorgiicola]TCS47961.1 signal transduction histidine kinase [Pseudobacteriovorax antillogorgiicola]SMF58179.1 Signal transduction histidine kinase [Pseudobacteriovorax antillogorgiicola]
MDSIKIQETYSKFSQPDVGDDPLAYYRELTENLKLLHSTISSSFENFEDLLSSYLKVGTKIFQLETGIVSNIKGNIYEVIAVDSELPIENGAQLELETTYCRDVYHSQKTIAFPNVGADNILCQHPCYQSTNLESYISAPIWVDGEIFGTINFSSMKKKDRMFSTDQKDIIDLMAKNVGDFITKAKRTDQLMKAHQKINFFIGTVAHDLRNPLGAMDSYVELLQEADSLDEVQGHLPQLQQCTQNALKMVNELLPLMSMKSGTFTITPTRFALKNLLEGDAGLFHSRLDEKNLELVFNLPTSLTVCADADKLSRAFQNLISNAIKFSNPGGKIVIDHKILSGRVEISVADSGVGIPKEVIPKLFDESSSISTKGTGGEAGTGLGLPYVAEILKAHNSEIRVESEEGVGTTFRFDLAA